MAKLIKFTGAVEEVKPADGMNCFALEELQGFVGGYIELVPFKPSPLYSHLIPVLLFPVCFFAIYHLIIHL